MQLDQKVTMTTILGCPSAGWVSFNLEDEVPGFGLSYLTDVPNEWIDQAIHGLETMLPFAVHGVCEPGRVVCTVSYWNCHIVFEGEDRGDSAVRTWSCHVSMLKFCERLHQDILSNLNEWAQWDCSEDEKTIAANKQRLQQKLDTLSALITEKRRHFGKNRCFF